MDDVEKLAAKLANIRLILLRAMAEDDDEAANTIILQLELQRFGYRRSRDFIANQLGWLEREVGAVSLVKAGSEVMASLTEAGRDHLARRSFLAGIQRPSAALDV